MPNKRQSLADISRLLLRPTDTVKMAVSAVERGHAQIALVIDEAGRLLGTVTDGDIRRALLRGQSLDGQVKSVMNSIYKALPESAGEDAALAMMRRESLQQIPVVQGEQCLTGLYLLKDLLHTHKHANQVVIMAGGEGRRLRPLTENCPKPMLKVGEKPLLEIILQNCVDSGFSDFYFSVNYLKHHIIDYFGDGTRWGVSIRYMEEETALGTAGALTLMPEWGGEPVVVLNGDVLTRVDVSSMLRFHSEHFSHATVGIREHSTIVPYGVVSVDEIRVLELKEKPVLSHYVNAGIYLLNSEVIKLIPKRTNFNMPDLLNLAILRNYNVAAFPIHEYWLDVGHPETLQQAYGDWV
jgi:dTDP-glucose pyrophosphorylase/predicted transcriptional regulator